mmetsp:Transcript_1897/g.4378  ORF Transcript_1897/g.4378 Transcript_1897/m.4378 type:complete len:140 (-) Transcript_1897:153-572(-)
MQQTANHCDTSPWPVSSMDESHTSLRSKGKVKPDKNQRAALQSLDGADVLQLLLQQVFERASLDGVLSESFYLQQQIHWEIEKYSSPRLSSPKTRRTMRNLHTLRTDHSFLDHVHTVASFRAGNTCDLNGVRLGKSVWL